ncbi:MAG: ARPP-1 family domain-containing protein [Bacteroidales bacterium]
METTTKTLTSYGNCTLVQFEIRPESKFSFKPGGPEIITGGLIISESNGNGVVGKLIAVNNTGSFLLLTDADVLSGAKQNRVLNKSTLLSPYSKTIIDVSCVERGRWQYTTRNFTSPATSADATLRKTKAQSLSEDMLQPEDNFRTQQKVWSHISFSLSEEGYASATESYSDLVFHKEKKQKPRYPVFEPENGCNGLAVLIDRKIACVDIFGTEEVYKHYFPKLRDSAFLQAIAGKEKQVMDVHEAFFKVLDLLDRFETTEKTPDKSYSGAGLLSIRDGNEFVGVGLECEGQLIHCGLFGK